MKELLHTGSPDSLLSMIRSEDVTEYEKNFFRWFRLHFEKDVIFIAQAGKVKQPGNIPGKKAWLR